MRIFYLTTEFLWPAHQGGRVRSLAQLRLLCALPEVRHLTLLGMTEVAVAAADQQALQQTLQRAASATPKSIEILEAPRHPIHLRQAPRALARVLMQRLRTGVPYLAAKWDSPALRALLTLKLGAGGYDVVYIDHLGMALYLPEIRRRLPAARVVLEEHNVESDFFSQFATRLPPPLQQLAEREVAAARRFEAETLRAVDAVVAISAADAHALHALMASVPPRSARNAPLPVVVPQVVPVVQRTRTPPAPPRLCYVGNLTWHPNVHGLNWFCQRVWPRVRAALPAITLTIAGSGLGSDAQGRVRCPAAWRSPGIEVVGYLPDLETLYQRSVAMIAPIAGGSGIRIKLLEGLRAGMPVVTTPAGAAGLPLTSGIEVLIEEDPLRFARAVVTLCQDAALQERLRQAGYRYLAAHHNQALAESAMRTVLGLPTPTPAERPPLMVGRR